MYSIMYDMYMDVCMIHAYSGIKMLEMFVGKTYIHTYVGSRAHYCLCLYVCMYIYIYIYDLETCV
jgi:hypothetical protein